MYTIKPISNIKRKITVPPDKSISHRALMISALAKGTTHITPFIANDDTAATLECLKRLGIKAHLNNQVLTITGHGLYFPKNKPVSLYAHESGTTLRLLSGILCAQKFLSEFNAAPTLAKRPMGRITAPLRAMGADIRGKRRGAEEHPPLTINPIKKIHGIKYTLPIASAQVKSAIIFASLYAENQTVICEPILTRDHTERMLKQFRAPLMRDHNRIICNPAKGLKSPGKLFIPSDFSSAAFFIVLGAITPQSEILIRNVNLNPTRCGLLDILKRMKANITISHRVVANEPYGDILIKSSQLKATNVNSREAALTIDEIPILCVAASFAKGTTCIQGVKELKVKETDRLVSIVTNLKKTGVDIAARKIVRNRNCDWDICIKGGKDYKSAHFKSFHDHRTAMSLIVFAKALGNKSTIDDVRCINKSFPQFISLIESL
jgi:3-phosphoshikimate 1-carboxyvinyltransferase